MQEKQHSYRWIDMFILYIYLFIFTIPSVVLLQSKGHCGGNAFILQTSRHHSELQVLFLVLPCTKQRVNLRHGEASCQDVNPLLLSWL